MPRRFQFNNFIAIFTEIPLIVYLANSTIVSVFSMLINIVVAVPAAWALARFNILIGKLFLLLILVAQMFSPVVVAIPLFEVIVKLGLFDTYQALILVNSAFALSFSVWLLFGYFRSIPTELEGAAMIDGCSRIQALIRVTLPLAAPGIVAAAIYVFITVWNEFMFALTFTGSGSMRLVTVGLYDFVSRNYVEWHLLMATAIVCLVPIIVLFAFIRGFLVSGLTAGATKG